MIAVQVAPKKIEFQTENKAKITYECGHFQDWDFGTDPEDYTFRRTYPCYTCARELMTLLKERNEEKTEVL